MTLLLGALPFFSNIHPTEARTPLPSLRMCRRSLLVRVGLSVTVSLTMERGKGGEGGRRENHGMNGKVKRKRMHDTYMIRAIPLKPVAS